MLYLSIYLSISMSIHIYLSISDYSHLSVYPSIYLSQSIYISLSLFTSINLSISVYLSVILSLFIYLYLYSHLSIYLSIYLSEIDKERNLCSESIETEIVCINFPLVEVSFEIILIWCEVSHHFFPYSSPPHILSLKWIFSLGNESHFKLSLMNMEGAALAQSCVSIVPCFFGRVIPKNQKNGTWFCPA